MGQLHGQSLKPREPRRKVLIKARMRAGTAWTDVCLLNMSSRGMLMQSSVPPLEGAYIEVRRGRHVIIARVVWTKKHRFGVRTQDLLSIDAIATEQDNLETTGSGPEGAQSVERRSVARQATSLDKHQRNRLLGRSIEFGFVLVAGTSLAFMCASFVQAAVSKPLTAVTAALAR